MPLAADQVRAIHRCSVTGSRGRRPDRRAGGTAGGRTTKAVTIQPSAGRERPCPQYDTRQWGSCMVRRHLGEWRFCWKEGSLECHLSGVHTRNVPTEGGVGGQRKGVRLSAPRSKVAFI